MDELPDQEQDLIRRAVAEAENAYAPYSEFRVGAAAILPDQTIVGASNMENVAYPQCLCAEQVLCATVKAHFNDQPIKKMAVYSPNWKEQFPLSPCGSCRQILLEKEKRLETELVIFLKNFGGDIWKINTVSHLLPFGFK